MGECLTYREDCALNSHNSVGIHLGEGSSLSDINIRVLVYLQQLLLAPWPRLARFCHHCSLATPLEAQGWCIWNGCIVWGWGERERGDQNAFKAQTKSAETQDELKSCWQGGEAWPAVMRREVLQSRFVPGWWDTDYCWNLPENCNGAKNKMEKKGRASWLGRDGVSYLWQIAGLRENVPG